MKAFRGTFGAALAVLVLGGAWWVLQPSTQPATTPAQRKADATAAALFPFEKANLVKVEVVRADGTLVLEERGDGWWLANENVRASRSMVSRVKHQLHDLTARATIEEGARDAALYGLGASAIHVTLTMRDGSVTAFDAGDPNPTGVSFYVRRAGDDRVFTVKKSAVDYYSLALDEFRERRFASFDSKDVDALEATLPDGARLAFQRGANGIWDMLAPTKMAVDEGAVRGLLGRVSALKAVEFVQPATPRAENAGAPSPGAGADLAAYGLEAPRARIVLRFSGKPALTLLIGRRTGATEGDLPLAWAKIEDEPTVYVVRDDLLEEYAADPQTFRLRRIVRVQASQVTQATVTLSSVGAGADGAAGTASIRSEAGTWLWADGQPVSGSTPERVVSRVAEVEADSFVEGDARVLRGFEAPRARVVLTLDDGSTRTLVVGAEGPGREVAADPGGRGEARVLPRFYARVEGESEIVLVDDGVLSVCKDLIREHGRKADGDADQRVRQDRIAGERTPDAARTP